MPILAIPHQVSVVEPCDYIPCSSNLPFCGYEVIMMKPMVYDYEKFRAFLRLKRQ